MTWRRQQPCKHPFAKEALKISILHPHADHQDSAGGLQAFHLHSFIQRCVQECWLPPMICFVFVCACVLRSGLLVRSGKESCGCQQLEARKRNEFVLQGLGLLECPSVPSAPAVFGSSSTSTSPLLCSAWKRA